MWLAGVFQRKQRYDDLSVSIAEHLEEKIDELMEGGMTRREAEQAARREFGSVTQIQERSREQWQWPAVESILRDMRYALRKLRRAPGFAITVVLTLAIGIGANTAVFSVLNCLLFKPLPYPEPDQLVDLRLLAPGAPGLMDFYGALHLSASMDLTFAAHNKAFQSVGVYTLGTANITGLAEPEEVHTVQVSSGVLETLNVPAIAGRWFAPAEQLPRGPQAVILGYGYWQRRFGGERSAIGRTIDIDSRPHVIVGVMPQGYGIVNNDFDLLTPLAFDPNKQIAAGFGFTGIGRLKPGVTIAQANADITRLLGVWMDSWSNGPGTDAHFYLTWKISPALRPLKEMVVGEIGSMLWVVMGTIGLVMLIACTNIANLLLVRAEGRQQELSVRAALGAGRARIARELLIESVTLGLIGGIAGLAVAFGGLRLLVALKPANLPRLSEIALDARSVAFTVALSVLAGLIFGAIPALKYAGARQLLALNSNSGRSASVSRERLRGRFVLVVTQVAMALVLLVSAVLMIRTFAALHAVDPGFSDPQHLQTLRTSIPATLVSDPVQVVHLQQTILDKLAAVPGVTSAGMVYAVPMQGIGHNWDDVYFQGRVYPNNEPPMRLYSYVVPGYFHTMGTRILAGRDITWDDIYTNHPVGIITENLARENFGSAAAALGQHFREYPSMPWHEVIGVVQDVSENGVDEKAPALVYWPPFAEFGPGNNDAMRSVTFVVRSNRAGSDTLIRELQQAIWSVNGSLPVASIQTMDQIYSQSLARTSFTLTMLGIAGSMALILGILGIYGVISYSVAQRRREIGIRLALGAQRQTLRWMFVRSALVLTGIGVAIGLCAASGLMQLMKSLLFGISPLDPLTYISVPLVLLFIGMLASVLPAQRAAAVDPAEALRAD